MATRLFFLLFTLGMILSRQTSAQGQCSSALTSCPNNPQCTNPTPVGDPVLLDENATGDCAAGISRYLARMVQMDGLQDLINGSGECPSSGQDLGSNCTPPYAFSWDHFCPCVYCDQLKYLTEINAQFIGQAFHAAALQENNFYPNTPSYCLGQKMINDINHAYDCAGLRRPIVQAVVGQIVDPNNLHDPNGLDYSNISDGINREISAQLILDYDHYFPGDMDEIDPQTNLSYRQYYFDGNNNPQTGLYFRRDHLIAAGTSDYEITFLEMRMWFFYQATTAIDFGYKAIHMGIYWIYADNERPLYLRLYDLTTAIRQYAKDHNTFVLLSGETPMQDVDNGLSATYNGTNQFIFDFDSRAMRPREVATGISGDGNATGNPSGCNYPIPQATLDAINDSPCGNVGSNFNAVVDPCTIQSFGGSIGGVSPMGCYYDHMPYAVHWDGGSGIAHTGEDCSDFCFIGCGPGFIPAGQASPGPVSLTWGFEDCRWFGQQYTFDVATNTWKKNNPILSSECRQWWFDHFYCEQRNSQGGNGFIMIPGNLYMRYVERYCLNPPNNAGGMYLMTDDDGFVDLISHQTLKPKLPSIAVNPECDEFHCEQVCNGQQAPLRKKWLVGKRYYKIDAGNRDCSSVYTIRIKAEPQGNWTWIGENGSAYFLPPAAGYYRIAIRQQNLGLKADGSDGSDGQGTREIGGVYYLDPVCCQGTVPFGDCLHGRPGGEPEETVPAQTDFALIIYPNPTSADLNLNFVAPSDETVALSVTDALGKVRIVRNLQVTAGENQQVLDTGSLLPGTYILRIQGQSGLVSQRFSKQ